MNYKKSSEISEKCLNKIISAAYGNASLIDTIQVKRLIKKNSELKALYEEYRRTAEAVHSLKIEEYNSESNFVPRELNNKQKSMTILEELYSVFLGKPVVYGATITILLISILFSVFSNREISYNGYTLAEVKKAKRESRIAISIVSEIFSETGTTLKTDILYKEVSKPINEGINTVNKLFNKEIKQ